MVYGEGACLTMDRDDDLTPTRIAWYPETFDFILNLITSSSTIFRHTLLEMEDGKDVCAYQLLTRVLLLFIIM